MKTARTLLALLVLTALFATGCRTNLLPEYMPKVKTAYVVTFANELPSVDIAQQSDNSSSIIRVITDVATVGFSIEMRQRLIKALDGVDLAVALSETFEQQLTPSFGTALVGDINAPHDTEIQITVNDYGLEAASIADPVYYFFNADVRMMYVSENKLIWEYTTTISERLKPVHLTGDGGAALVGTAINFSALKDMTDEQLTTVFDNLARNAGVVIVDQMRYDATK